jgi:hypothetical protein
MDLGLDGLRALVGGGSGGRPRHRGGLLVEGPRCLTSRPGTKRGGRGRDRRRDLADRPVHRRRTGEGRRRRDRPARQYEPARGQQRRTHGRHLRRGRRGGLGGYVDGVLYAALRLIRAGLPHLRESPIPDRESGLARGAVTLAAGVAVQSTSGSTGEGWTVGPDLAIRINGIAPGRVATPRIAEIDGMQARLSGRPIEEVRAATMARIPLGRYGQPPRSAGSGPLPLSPAAGY